MTVSGSLLGTSVHGTWLEAIEVRSADDDTLYNFSALTEIQLLLLDPQSKFAEMTLSMTNGNITLPSLGIIQWRVESGHMRTLMPKLYEVILLLQDATDTVPLLLGSVSIVE